MQKIQKIVPFLLTALLLLVYLAILADSYKNPNKIINSTFINPYWILLLTILINIYARINKSPPLPGLFLKFNALLLLPVALISSVFLSIWTYISPPNLVYSRFPVNFQQLFILSLGCLTVGLINFNFAQIKKNLKTILFFTPVLILFVGQIIRIWPNDAFFQLTLEDNLVENTQFLLLTLAFIFAFSLSITLFKAKLKTIATIYLIAGIGLIFIAGEEISWGQRIIGLATPDLIARENTQQELTVHNLYSVHNLIRWLYVAIGTYGAFSWIGFKFKKIKQMKNTNFLIIPFYLTLYFLPIALYNFLENPAVKHPFGEWSEVMELLFYSGIFLFTFLNSLEIKKYSH